MVFYKTNDPSGSFVKVFRTLFTFLPEKINSIYEKLEEEIFYEYLFDTTQVLEPETETDSEKEEVLNLRLVKLESDDTETTNERIIGETQIQSDDEILIKNKDDSGSVLTIYQNILKNISKLEKVLNLEKAKAVKPLTKSKKNTFKDDSGTNLTIHKNLLKKISDLDLTLDETKVLKIDSSLKRTIQKTLKRKRLPLKRYLIKSSMEFYKKKPPERQKCPQGKRKRRFCCKEEPSAHKSFDLKII